MQVPSVPPPLITNTLPQDVATKAAPNAQAIAPIVQRAVDPTPKTEKFNDLTRNRDKSKRDRGQEREERGENDKESDHSVNIRI